MKLRILALRLGLAAAAAMICAGGALAQGVPEQFVVSGKAAEKIQDFTTINLATAERLAEMCEGFVKARGGSNGHSIMILDNDGNQVYSDRMDGQGYQNIVTAEFKARTTLMKRAPSKSVMNSVERDENIELQTYQLGFYPVSGGLPIVVNKQLIGVMGVGGYPPNPPVWSDEICAERSLVQVIGPLVPPLLEDIREVRLPTTVPIPRFAAAAPPQTTVPSEFVVTGAGAANVFDANQISLAAAKKIARVCRDWEATKGGTMAAYILNDAGELVHMERMDGQVAEDIRTALLKAQTALRRRQPTSIDAAQLANNPSGIPRSSVFWHYFAVPGGIPIVVDGQMIGAVGVTVGEDKGGDEDCAIEGLKATFGQHATLPVYPAEAADVP
jgi:glc operon protein GlcG